MSPLNAGRPTRSCVVWRFNLCLVVVIVLSVSPVSLLAHEFGAGQGAYKDFLSGNRAVLADNTVLLGLVAAGLLSGIWKPDGFPSLWPFYAGGVVAGAAVGFYGMIPPTLPTYVAVIAVGLLGAAAPQIPTGLVRGIFFVIGLVLTNAVLSGHRISEITPFAYVGIAFALNVGVVVPAGLVAVSREKLPYGWVAIAWRAVMSWLVAIAVMAMALMLKSTP